MEFSLEKDICIVGTGFCGYTAYKKLSNHKFDLLVVEGGEIENPTGVDDQLNYQLKHNNYSGRIEINGKIANVKSSIDLSFNDRQYTLGGSSGRWAGYIKPLEASTFLNKFEHNSFKSWGNLNLEKYNKESLKLLNSPIDDFNPLKVAESLKIKLPELPKGFYYTVYSWAESPLRLKDFWQDKATPDPKKITSKKNVLYGFKLVDVYIKNDKINYLEFRSKNHKLLVKANLFILGLGGVENARFTKIINSKHHKTNEINKNVGNFQEHPHLYQIGSFNFGSKAIPKILTQRIPYYANGRIIGRVKFNIVAWDGLGTPKVSFDIVTKESKSIKDSLLNYIKSKIKGDCYVTMRCEQTPNAKSNLDFEKNKVNWNVIESDFKLYSDYLRKYISFLKFSSMAKDFKLLQKDSQDGYAFPTKISGGAHHMGTVPYFKSGAVIDSSFRHKIFSNIYIVGSSAFPTSGFENPTHGAIATTLSAVEDIIKIKRF